MNQRIERPARERILQTAHDLFYRHGIRATGIDRIIAESGVTKVTFYRHFPSKSELILTYLTYRHERWIAWFRDAIVRHGAGVEALTPALAEWLQHPEYRGCAFINTVGELGTELPEVVEIARRHKDDMTRVITELLVPRRKRCTLAMAITVAIDGAIVRAQYDETPKDALQALTAIVGAILDHGVSDSTRKKECKF